ncbi:glycosyltransferase family 4 protein [Desulfonema magnum]|uniref:Glycosyltransferase domain-containing protein n=1 Tax=Desulfonema magnum TaxID=45655 RepID=A0A975GLM4_9BACT|nr:glycosyltransferase family 4 protein [Desulfonema magnum]QTA85991.1 Glycosyltransferase domain-containing protein [Desulfonema magnum]
MKILLLSRYESLGSRSRIRSYQYLPYLSAEGLDVTPAPLLGNDYIRDLYAGRNKDFKAIIRAYFRRLGYLLKSRSFDLLWIENEVLPLLPSWCETLLSFAGIPYVVDYDDAVFHQYDMHSNGIMRTLLGKKIDTIMRNASLVIVGNNYLEKRARQAGAKKVECLPSVIDLKRYHKKPKSDKSVFTIGWIGCPVTAEYLRLVRPALTEICRNNSARLVFVGSGEIREYKEDIVEIRPWTEETEVRDIQEFDVGIMPLPDTPWTRGKCGYKLIQYMACSLPVIASPVGINREIVEHGINGFLASDTTSWVEALKILKKNHKLRKQMGKAGCVKVEKAYCIQVTAPRLLSLIRSIGC